MQCEFPSPRCSTRLSIFRDKTGKTQGIKFRIKPPRKDIPAASQTIKLTSVLSEDADGGVTVPFTKT